jgi:hypothetical protein
MTRFTEFAPRQALGHIAFAAVGAVSVALATPAVAQSPAGVSPISDNLSISRDASGGGAPVAARRQSRDAGSERRYCVDDAYTGTRLTRRVCKTAREWEASGGLEGVTDR